MDHCVWGKPSHSISQSLHFAANWLQGLPGHSLLCPASGCTAFWDTRAQTRLLRASLSANWLKNGAAVRQNAPLMMKFPTHWIQPTGHSLEAPDINKILKRRVPRLWQLFLLSLFRERNSPFECMTIVEKLYKYYY